MAESLDEPLGVVPGDELADDPARLRERLEAMEIEALLFERTHEALDDAVALRLPDVRWRDGHPEPLHLIDPRIGDVLWPPVAADPEPAGDVLREATEHVAHALAQWLERGPAITDLRGVPPDELVDAVIDRTEEPAPAVLLGVEAGRVGAPHLIRPRRGDRAGVRRIAVRRPLAPWRQELMLAHQPQDALAADGEPAMGEPRADLPVALAVERRRDEHRPDRRNELAVADRRLRAALRPEDRHAGRGRHRQVHRRARHAQGRADHRQRIPPTRAGTHGTSHRRCFFHSSASPLFSMRYSASSSRIISSPIFARARVSSRSSGSLRVFSPRAPWSRNTRFQASSSWAGTWLSRETASSASPRRSRSTNSVFRCTLQRSGSSTTSAGGGSLPGVVVGFRALSFMPGLLGCRHRSPDGVQRNRVRFTSSIPHSHHRRQPKADAGGSLRSQFWIRLLNRDRGHVGSVWLTPGRSMAPGGLPGLRPRMS